MEDARADAPVTEDSKELTVTEAVDVLSEKFRSEPSPVEDRPLETAKEENEPDLPVLSDDTKVALKDGTRVSLRELKRGYISRKSFTTKSQALAEERARFNDLKTSTENHARLLSHRHEALDRALFALMPRPIDPDLIDSDPQRFKALTADYQETMALLAQVQQAARMEFEAAQEAQEAENRDASHRQLQAYEAQFEQLLKVMPELSQDKSREQFIKDAVGTMSGYGFSKRELDAFLSADIRFFSPLRDLIRFNRALKRVPEVKQDIQNKPKLLGGSKRMDRTAQRVNAEARAAFEHSRKSGKLEDAGAALARRMKV